MLDVARDAYDQCSKAIYSHRQELCTEFGIDLEIRYEYVRGFYFRLPNTERLPPVFVNVVKKKKYLEFGTIELCKRNKKVSTTPPSGDRSYQEEPWPSLQNQAPRGMACIPAIDSMSVGQ